MKIRLSCDVKDINSFINTIQKKYHFTDDDIDELMEIYQQIQLAITPYAEYRINRHTTGVELIDGGMTAAVAMSLGSGLDRLQERYMRGEKLSEAYMIDCISSELLLIMYKEFNASYARFHRRYVDRYVFIGDAIPVTKMREVLNFISTGNADAKSGVYRDVLVNANVAEGESDKSSNNEIVTDTQNDKVKRPIAENGQSDVEKNLAYRDEISANEYGVLTPSKSVVFYAILSENPATRCQGICLGCGNVECENRYQEIRQLPESMSRTRNGYGDEKRENKVVELNYGYQRIFGSKN